MNNEYWADEAKKAAKNATDMAKKHRGDVPELVRYGLACDFNGRYYPDIVEVELGKYVRYDQAAAMIAAKDGEIEELRRTLSSIDAGYNVYGAMLERAEAAEAKLGFKDTGLKIAMSKIKALEGKLSQLEAQKPVAYRNRVRNMKGELLPDWDYRDDPFLSGLPEEPLYAAPVDRTAEIERLREALEFLVDTLPKIDSNEHFNGDQSKWNDYCDAIHMAVRALSGKEPS